MTARTYDINGWPEIKGNPISKAGVFPYSGAQISDDLEPNKIYWVYRPEEELRDEACLESFRLVPWTDDHELLGDPTLEDGLTPAEKIGIHGVIGEDVYFEDGYLKANVKIFSTELAKLIESGKNELSIGYRCKFVPEKGIFNGKPYDFTQRELRGNHLASVQKGRAGPDVAVLDKWTFVVDAQEFNMEEVGQGVSLNDVLTRLNDLVTLLTTLSQSQKKEEEVTEELVEKIEETGEAAQEIQEDVTEDPVVEELEVVEDEDDKEDEPKEKREAEKSMDVSIQKVKDAAIRHVFSEISQRDALARQLSYHIGTFDHASKTLKDVVEYGAKKLGLKCNAKDALPMLKGFLAAKKNSKVAVAKDSQIVTTRSASKQIDDYLQGVQ